MFQALKFYSEKMTALKNRTNIYLAEKKDEDMSFMILDKTNGLNAIFQN